MKVYMLLKTESVPSDGIQIVQEGTLLRVFFDYAADDTEITDENGDKVEHDPAYTAENVDIRGSHDYASIVSAIIRDHYSNDDESAIIFNNELAKDSDSDITDDKRTEYLQEYSAFQDWRSHAKEVAKKVISKLNS